MKRLKLPASRGFQALPPKLEESRPLKESFDAWCAIDDPAESGKVAGILFSGMVSSDAGFGL
jgi:hypothetical protein